MAKKIGLAFELAELFKQLSENDEGSVIRIGVMPLEYRKRLQLAEDKSEAGAVWREVEALFGLTEADCLSMDAEGHVYKVIDDEGTEDEGIVGLPVN